MPIEHINKTDTLNEGREKLNAAIDGANSADITSQEADTKATQALANSESTQTQLDTIVIDGDSSVEAAQARVDEKGVTHPTLKARIDDGLNSVNQQLAQTDEELFKNSMVNHKKGSFKVLWIDDDAHVGVYTKLAPFLRSHNIRISSAVVTNWAHGFPISGLPAHDNIFLSYPQMKELQNEGIVEFIPHTHTHDLNNTLADMSVSELHEELKTNRNIMRMLGFNYRDLVYPFGVHNEQIHDVVRQYFRTAYTLATGVIKPPFNQFAMPRIRCDHLTAQEIIAEIDEAIENNTLAVLCTHVDQYGGLDMDKMETVVQHILNNGGEFISAKEGHRDFGNLLQVKDLSISYDGEMHGAIKNAYNFANLDYNPNASILDFPKGVTTRVKVRKIDAIEYGLPVINGETPFGVIEVYRDGAEDLFSFRKFTSTTENTVLTSSWRVESESWSDWSDITGYKYGGIEYPPNTPLTMFQRGVVTRLKVRQVDAVEYGIPTVGQIVPYGFLEVYRDEYEDQFSFRKFTSPNTNSILISSWEKDMGSWGRWIDVASYKHRGVDYQPNSSITQFPRGSTTRLKVRRVDAITYGLPTNGGVYPYGFIEVYRDDAEDDFSSRIFTNIETGETLISKWSQNNNSWGVWV